MHNIAAIDIGSNAIRLVIATMDDHGDIKLLKKVREPVRLGQEVFAGGEISKKTLARSILAFKRFKQMMREYSVQSMRAVATSALREASNRQQFIGATQKACGFKIDLIDGLEEAGLIHEAVSHRLSIRDKNALLIDIGGGSVELVASIQGRVRAMESFRIGTVRILQALADKGLKERHLQGMLEQEMRPLKKFVQMQARQYGFDFCIGTGGNFECLGKLRVTLLHRTSIYSMTNSEVDEVAKHLTMMTIKDRIQFLRLRPDRADVVIPAALTISGVMRAAKCEMLYIPYVGLREGILTSLDRSVAKVRRPEPQRARKEI